MTDHCMCQSCAAGTLHASDCAVHNEPAMPNGPCDCWVAKLDESRRLVRALVDAVTASERNFARCGVELDGPCAVAEDALDDHLRALARYGIYADRTWLTDDQELGAEHFGAEGK